jgi:hypothetical protein
MLTQIFRTDIWCPGRIIRALEESAKDLVEQGYVSLSKGQDILYPGQIIRPLEILLRTKAFYD